MIKNDNENIWDGNLNIKTSGRDDTNADAFNYPYEPTPYSVLERLAQSGYIKKKNKFIDYGCGKGRAGLFLTYETGCRSIGIEYDERIYEAAVKNKMSAYKASKAEFINICAEKYEIDPDADRFYFFNPFSVEILKKVMKRIIKSYYDNPRSMLLFFYYPSDEYVSYLMMVNEIEFSDEIDCSDLFEGPDSREKILVFESLK